ncbi:MAG TPA: hypothetical protein VM053_01930 [Gemmatimonadaceae bacterium]|nr:hypothetical protein [Gemmatimonadaceae bacterium]
MPDNAVFYHLAYGISAAIYVAYAVRLSMKRSKLRSQRAKPEVR